MGGGNRGSPRKHAKRLTTTMPPKTAQKRSRESVGTGSKLAGTTATSGSTPGSIPLRRGRSGSVTSQEGDNDGPPRAKRSRREKASGRQSEASDMSMSEWEEEPEEEEQVANGPAGGSGGSRSAASKRTAGTRRKGGAADGGEVCCRRLCNARDMHGALMPVLFDSLVVGSSRVAVAACICSDRCLTCTDQPLVPVPLSVRVFIFSGRTRTYQNNRLQYGLWEGSDKVHSQGQTRPEVCENFFKYLFGGIPLVRAV